MKKKNRRFLTFLFCQEFRALCTVLRSVTVTTAKLTPPPRNSQWIQLKQLGRLHQSLNKLQFSYSVCYFKRKHERTFGRKKHTFFSFLAGSQTSWRLRSVQPVNWYSRWPEARTQSTFHSVNFDYREQTFFKLFSSPCLIALVNCEKLSPEPICQVFRMVRRCFQSPPSAIV